MELTKAIYQRRATRAFTDADISPAVVHELLRAATQAPSALNLQPWVFVVLHGRQRLARYSQRAKDHLLATSEPSFGLDPRVDRYASSAVNIFHGADTLVLICARAGRFASAEDCCLAAQNLMLAAHGSGLGTCPVGFARPWFALPEVGRELGIPPDCLPVMPIVIGHPADALPPAPKREPEIAAWHWDE